jgi:hypothetical protein
MSAVQKSVRPLMLVQSGGCCDGTTRRSRKSDMAVRLRPHDGKDQAGEPPPRPVDPDPAGQGVNEAGLSGGCDRGRPPLRPVG